MHRIKLVVVMIIWGSLGVFTRSIPLSALSLAFLRAVIALPVLLVVLMIRGPKKVKLSLSLLRPYIISGILLGFGWLTLFYGFKNTSISSAVIIYNMCPVYVLIAAPFILKERITKIQITVIVLSFLGLFMIVSQNLTEGVGIMGMVLSAASGMMYAVIVLINRSIKDRIDNQVATFIQILVAMLVLLPFVIMDGSITAFGDLELTALIFTILLGVVHTGLAYTLFFSVYAHLKSVEVVSYSYLEPLFGILFGVVFIGEKLSSFQIVGGILILGSTYIGEVIKRRNVEKENVSSVPE